MGHMNVPEKLGVIVDNPVYLDSFRHHARETLQQIGHLPDTPLWQYLHWRRALNPVRFDRYHPEFRKLFRDEARHHPEIPAAPVLPIGTTPVVIPPPSFPPPMMGTVPEPTSGQIWGVILGLVLVVAYGAGRRR
jgi:hypothetical protein